MHPRLNVLPAFHACARRIPRSQIRTSHAPRYASSNAETAQPNPPLDLDPSFQALLRDVDISLERHNPKGAALPSRRELEALPVEGNEGSLLPSDDVPHEEYSLRKSPAAHFGSQRIGAVILPLELQASITSIIAGECNSHTPSLVSHTNSPSQSPINSGFIRMPNVSSLMKGAPHRRKTHGKSSTMLSTGLDVRQSAITNVMELPSHLLHFPLISQPSLLFWST